MLRPLAPPFLGLLVFLAVASFGEDRSDLPAFSPVQPELFAQPGALANAWADVNGDGDLDLAVSFKSGAILLYEQTAGAFEERGVDRGLPAHGDELRALAWGDFDHDGDPDLLAGSNVSPIPSRSYFFVNEGGVFLERALAMGLSLPGRSSRQGNWVDIDGDGDLDFYAADRSGPNRLLWNDEASGGRSFRAAPFRFGTVDIRRTVGACWFDFDRDGDLDLFLANQSGDSDALWRNDGERFVDVAGLLGLDQTLRTLSEGGVGCAPGDYDNDGDLDLFVGTYGHNHLYRNDEEDGFLDVASDAGVAEPHSVVGAAWGDVDNDGDLDLFLASYERANGVQVPANRLYLNQGDGTFKNVLTPEHLINAADHGVVWVDFDRDGDLDLSLTDGYGPTGGSPVFRNELPEQARAPGLTVRILDELGYATQAGSVVMVVDEQGRSLGARQLSAGGGYNSQSDIGVHVVRPMACSACRLRVIFNRRAGAQGAQEVDFPLPDLGVSWVEVKRPRFPD